MNQLTGDKRYLVLTGNYGSGKTELSLNLALSFAKQYKTTLAEEMRAAGIRMLMPTYAMTTVDIPALPAEIQSVFEVPSDRVVFDVGGDDTGAAALGRYYPSFMARRDDTLVMFVVNCMRPLTRETDEIIDLAQRIQNRGRLKIDVLINNTNLADQTEPGMVEAGEKAVLSCAEKLGISRVFTTGKKDVLEQCRLETPTMIMKRYMAPEWMEDL